MKKTSLLNLLLAVVVLVLSAQMVLQKNASNTDETVKNAAFETIMTRTSIRQFTAQPIDSATVDTLLRAAMAAPTARNSQPWHFVVINDKAQINRLKASSRHAGPLNTATLCIAVCGDMDKTMEGIGKDFWIQDVSAATENLLLAAHAVGLGAVWTGAYPIEERVSSIQEALELPPSIVPLAVVALGYPDEQPEPKQKFKEENISYNVFGGQ